MTTRKAARIRVEPLIAFGVPLNGSGIVLPGLGSQWFVNGAHTGAFGRGDSFDHPLQTVQAAVDAAAAGDMIFIAPTEYDEDVTVSTSRLTLVGAGPRGSVRITGVAAGTATALTLSGAAAQLADCGLYNLNLEGRTGGSGLEMTGQIRRVEVRGCKIGGNDQAVLMSVPASSQFVDVRFEDCVIADAAIGISVSYSGGDPGHKLVVKDCVFQKITTDCILENGATHDYAIYGNIFTAADDTLPTQFLDIDSTGSTGFVCGNYFAGSLWSTALFAIASGVLVAGNYTEAESGGGGASGATGRPDA